MAEVRTLPEGTLWWVAQSGTGRSWATASAPVSGLMGFVRSFQYTSAADYTFVENRGVPDHVKFLRARPIDIQVTFGWTGYQPTAVSGSGASVPMIMLEHKAAITESDATGIYHQFYGIPVSQLAFTEAEAENTVAYTLQALGMTGPTASGYCG